MPEIFDSLDIFESWFDVSEMLEEGSDAKILQQEREGQVISTLMKVRESYFSGYFGGKGILHIGFWFISSVGILESVFLM